jgi:hypothetical protein
MESRKEYKLITVDLEIKPCWEWFNLDIEKRENWLCIIN